MLKLAASLCVADSRFLRQLDLQRRHDVLLKVLRVQRTLRNATLVDLAAQSAEARSRMGGHCFWTTSLILLLITVIVH